MSSPLINQAVGAYFLRACVGQGGVAEVFRAEHRDDGRVLAVKVLRADRLGDRARARAFHQEFVLLQRLNHAGVPKALQMVELQKRPAMLMEFVPGTPLTRLPGPAGSAVHLRCLRQLAAVTAYLHSQRVVHHDLKLDNAILRDDGQLMLLDFGSAVQQSLGRSLTELFTRRVKNVFVSPTYVAPEVLRGRGPSLASDCYALGVCAWLLMAGRPPFSAATIDERLRDAERGAPSLAEAVPSLPPVVTKAIDACLHPDRELRLADAAQISRACTALESMRVPVA